MTRVLRALSLFSGAGGADMALEAVGIEVAGLCEIEPHARAVLRAHWPDTPETREKIRLSNQRTRAAGRRRSA